MSSTIRIKTVIIGGGQAGLSVGNHLARRNIPFVILEAHPRIGDSWRNRWDSLRLFSPARYDGLDGMPFPAPEHSFPTKDEMADYLEAYAARFALPVRTGARVDRLWREGDRYRVSAGVLQFEAEQVVIAMADYQRPRSPDFAATLDPAIVQMHSADYRSPSQLKPGGVLMVGAGNSGAEIALELARAGHRVTMSGPDTGAVPFRVSGLAARLVLLPLMFRVMFHRILTIDTPMGRKARPRMVGKATPLIRVKWQDLAVLGVERAGRTTGVRDGHPVLEDGRVPDVSNVIWSTGFHAGFSWIDLPVFDDTGAPQHLGGVVATEPGLSFVGLQFLYAMSSSMIHGVGRDADRIAGIIARRVASPAGREAPAAELALSGKR